MAVFVAASDESFANNKAAGAYIYGGFVAPAAVWSDFAAAWDERVLAGPPRIPYLHMTDIRSREWRETYDLSITDAERRVDEAFRIFKSTGRLHPITSQVSLEAHKKHLSSLTIGPTDPVEPDYMCFIWYAQIVIDWVSAYYPEADKIDFVVEQGDKAILRSITEFHGILRGSLEQDGRKAHADLVGDLIPGGKDRVPLQAADVMCWHERRRCAGMLSRSDHLRYDVLTRMKGKRHRHSDADVEALAAAASTF
jgi:hypothetical protein